MTDTAVSMNGNGRKLSYFLAGCIWAIAIGFASACIAGYMVLDTKIATAEEKAEKKSDEIRKEIKEDLKEIQYVQIENSKQLAAILQALKKD